MTSSFRYELSWPPLWPFGWRPSLVAWAEPRLQEEILAGLALALAALVLCLAAWRWRRARWLAGAALPLAYLAAIRLDLLLVAATPTSFHVSPTGFTARSVVLGRAVHARHCQGCHGPEAPRQASPRVDLTAGHLWDHPVGDLFWWVGHGMSGIDGSPTMPGFAGELSEAERWAVIDFLHATAAGAELARTGRWPHGFIVPDAEALCQDGSRVALSGLRGKPLHLIVEGVDGMAEGGDLPTILVGGTPRGSACAIADAEARQALAVILSLAPDDITGSQFLVSPEGWLLGHWYQGGAPAPDTLPFVAETLRSVCLSSPQANRYPGHH